MSVISAPHATLPKAKTLQVKKSDHNDIGIVQSNDKSANVNAATKMQENVAAATTPSQSGTGAAGTTPAVTKSPCIVPVVYTIQTSKAGGTNVATSVAATFATMTAGTTSKLIISQPISATPNKPITVPLNMSASKQQTVTYFSMVKAKPNEPNHLPAGLVPAPTNRKVVISSMAMPKVTGNRLPVTATTNSDQTKFSFVPIHSFKVQSDGTATGENMVKVICDSAGPKSDDASKEQKEKTYELSIKDFGITTTKAKNLPVLKPKVNANEKREDLVFTISIPDGKKQESGSFTIAIPSKDAISKIPKDTIITKETVPKPTGDEPAYQIKKTFPLPTLSHLVNISGDPNKPQAEKVTIYSNAAASTEVKDGVTTAAGLVKIAPKPMKEPCYKKSVSILKKNHFNFSDSVKIQQPLPLPGTLTTSTGALVITAGNQQKAGEQKPETESEENAAQKPPPASKGRRRKSNFSYRKDYDEEIITNDDNATDFRFEEVKKEAPDNGNLIKAPPTKGKVEECSNGLEGTLDKKSILEDFVDIDRIKSEEDSMPPENPMDILENEDYDIAKVLMWDDGIGTLPGSKVRFHYNELGILEFLSKDEYKKIRDEKRQERQQMAEAKQQSPNEELRCLECGCYGMPTEFLPGSNFCSYDCQNQHASTKKSDINKQLPVGHRAYKKRKRKYGYVKKHLQQNQQGKQNEDDQICSGEEEASNDGSMVDSKFSYPWQTGKRGYSWAKYLDHIKAVAAPLKLFKDPFPYSRNGFRPNMKLEGIDPQHPSYFCVLTVAEVQGYRIRLQFDGYPNNYDFWVNADSMDIFPAGWCEKYNHPLHPPPGYENDFNWMNYLKEQRATAAPRHLFHNRAGNAICPHGFRLGMKLEAVDRKNSSLVCVATITDLMDNRFLVHFDSWDDIYDYWADPSSPYIHPVGWCDQYGHRLTPPNDYPNPELFTWEKYLRDTKSIAVPVRAFKQRTQNGFRRGMRIECVDKRVPQLVRVATVADVKEHQIRVSFDGWPERYSYWVDDDSTDIHPVGWCQKTGHMLEPPLTPDDVYDNLDCPTVGCRGVGHIKGPKYSVHTTQKFCPYYEENIDLDKILPDRLLNKTCEKLPEAVVPVSREPARGNKISPTGMPTKPRVGRPPKNRTLDLIHPPGRAMMGKMNDDDDEDYVVGGKNRPGVKGRPLLGKRKYQYHHHRRRSPEDDDDDDDDDDLEEDDSKPSSTAPRLRKILRKDRTSDITLNNGYLTHEHNPSKQAWAKHSRYLNDYISKVEPSDPRVWSEDDVAELVESIPSCKDYGEAFTSHNIDGEAFLMLTQQDLFEILNIKLGPAIKLYNIILLLRRNLKARGRGGGGGRGS